jgi:serine/threonine protein phosphatase PrpC
MLTDALSHKANIMASGSTAVTCIIKNEGPNKIIYTANAGDSRAVLCRDTKAIRLSKDHKADDPVEVRRIEEAGGFVLKQRVCGILAVARSLGDHSLKRFVTGKPFTSSITVGGRQSCPFAIIACDGLWDVMSDQDAVDIVLKAMEQRTEHQASSWLIKEAMNKQSTDNISVLVVYF